MLGFCVLLIKALGMLLTCRDKICVHHSRGKERYNIVLFVRFFINSTKTSCSIYLIFDYNLLF